MQEEADDSENLDDLLEDMLEMGKVYSAEPEDIIPEELSVSDEELFAEYLDMEIGMQMYADGVASYKGTGLKKLTGVPLDIYKQLRTEVAKVADGETASAIFTMPESIEIRLSMSEIGVTSYQDADFGQKFQTKVSDILKSRTIMKYLLADCPYDLYWFDKTDGMSTGYSYYIEDGYAVACMFNFRFTPSAEYEADVSSYTLNLEKTGAAKQSAVNARSVVSNAAGKSDLEKLTYYKDIICENTSYNDDAASDDYTGGYGNPWQFIYVFDGDPDTNVVCEGYSKAFQYLCDKSTFTTSIESIIVSGLMGGGTGAGAHMWNLVNMDDGYNYIVDVTNCDEGSIGYPDKLFLAGTDGSVAGGYRFVFNAYNQTQYAYDDDTRVMYSEEELTLASDYYKNRTGYLSASHIAGETDDFLVEENHDLELGVIAQSDTSITYQWYAGTEEAGVLINGATGDTYTLENNVTDASYYCEVRDQSGNVKKIIFNVTVRNHQYGAAVVVREQTCTQGGIKEKTCINCGKTIQEESDPLGHNVVTDAKKEATCVAAGLTEGSHCDRCKEVLTAQTSIPALGHNVKTLAGKEATCEEAGLTEGSICERCKEVLTEQLTIPALGHNVKTIAGKEATCEEAGLTEGSYCERCNEVLTGQTSIPALGHKVKTLAGKEASCEEAGLTEGSYCERCQEVLTAQTSIPALGHSVKTVAGKEASCEEAGLTEGSYCERCNEVLTGQASIPALGHKVKTLAGKEASCEEAGLTEGSYCERCQEVLTEQLTIPALGHKVKTIAGKDASCTEDGMTEGSYCERCQEVLTEQLTIPAFGHDVVIDARKEATTEEDGLTEGSHCKRCNEVLSEQEVIPAHEHSFNQTESRIEPTCLEAGYEAEMACEICDYHKEGMTIPALGHSFSDNKCIRCEAYETLNQPVLSKVENVTTGVKVTWKAVSHAKYYRVYRKEGSGNWVKINDFTTATTFTDTKAVSGKTYYYAVKCASADQKKMISNQSTGVKIIALSVVTPEATNTTTGVKLTWTKVAGATGYKVIRKNGSGSYAALKTITSGSTVSFVDTKAASGTTYTYAVYATNGTTKAAVKGKTHMFLKSVTISGLTKTSTGVTIKWPKIAGAKGYYIYRKTGTGKYAKIKTITSGSTLSFSDTAVRSKKGTFTYYVQAYNGSYVSSYTAKSITK